MPSLLPLSMKTILIVAIEPLQDALQFTIEQLNAGLFVVARRDNGEARPSDADGSSGRP